MIIFKNRSQNADRIKKRWISTAVAVANLQILSAVAEEQLALNSIEEVHVTTHRIEKTLNEIPASVSVIDSEMLKTLQSYNLSDMFRYEPSISVEKTGSRFGDASINIRGIGGNRVLILQDGVRMPSGFGSAGTDQGRGSLNPLSLERIEILKGPASAIYGSDAIGGVVLFQTINPQQLVSANEGEAYSEISTGYASDEERSHISWLGASKLGAGYGLLQIDHQDFSELDINSDFDPNPKDGEQRSLLAKWTVNTSDKQHWDIIADYWEQEVSNDLLTNLGPVSGPPGQAVTDSTAEDESERWRIGVHHTAEDLFGLDVLHWQLDYQESEFHQLEQELQENPGSAIPPIPASAVLDEEIESFDQEQWTFSINGQFSAAGHTVVSGLDLILKEFSRPVDRSFYNLVTSTVSKTSAGVTYPGKTFPDTDTEQLGVYIQDDWEINDRLHVLAGLRYDYFNSDPNPDAAYNNFNLSGTPVESRSDDQWSPHLGVTYALSDHQQVYINYQTGFRAPPVDDQFISRAILIPVPGVPHEVVPNSDLGPETSEGFELGWRWNSAVFAANLAYYETTYEDFIDSKTIGFRDAPPLYVGPTSIRQIQYQNVDEVKIDGVEFMSTLYLSNLFDWSWQASFHAGFNVIDGENETTGQGLNSVGPDTVVLGVNVQNPQGNLGFGWNLRAAKQADDAEPLSFRGQLLEAYEPPGYGVNDMNVFWKPTKQLRIDAAVYNLFDKKYWGANSKGSNAAGELDAEVEPGRNFSINISYLF